VRWPRRRSAIALLGDAVTSIWLRDYGAAKPDRYEELLDYLAAERAAMQTTAVPAVTPSP
jgi:hypothetical protein